MAFNMLALTVVLRIITEIICLYYIQYHLRKEARIESDAEVHSILVAVFAFQSLFLSFFSYNNNQVR